MNIYPPTTLLGAPKLLADIVNSLLELSVIPPGSRWQALDILASCETFETVAHLVNNTPDTFDVSRIEAFARRLEAIGQKAMWSDDVLPPGWSPGSWINLVRFDASEFLLGAAA